MLAFVQQYWWIAVLAILVLPGLRFVRTNARPPAAGDTAGPVSARLREPADTADVEARADSAAARSVPHRNAPSRSGAHAASPGTADRSPVAGGTGFSPIDKRWMEHALGLARRAAEAGEVPVGAVLVHDGELVAEGWNRPVGSHDPGAHAEMIALREAGRRLTSYRLVGTTLYVTLEPCAMCAGAMIHARIARLVYGAPDPKSGACGSVLDVTGCDALNHRIDVAGGLLADRCGATLREFFAARRG